jgi:hypothetical protein
VSPSYSGDLPQLGSKCPSLSASRPRRAAARNWSPIDAIFHHFGEINGNELAGVSGENRYSCYGRDADEPCAVLAGDRRFLLSCCHQLDVERGGEPATAVYRIVRQVRYQMVILAWTLDNEP